MNENVLILGLALALGSLVFAFLVNNSSSGTKKVEIENLRLLNKTLLEALLKMNEIIIFAHNNISDEKKVEFGKMEEYLIEKLEKVNLQ